MPKQDTKNHTKPRQFRLGDPAEGRLEEIAAALGVDQTTALKLAIASYHRTMLQKFPMKSQPPP